MGAAILDMNICEHGASKCLNSDKINFCVLFFEFAKIFTSFNSFIYIF